MPTILSVGQCGYDHGTMARQLHKSFGADVVPASTFTEALTALRGKTFDLVLVNRVTDRDGTLGVNLVRTLKADEGLAGVPVMLVSNFEQAQVDAEKAGALPGFGKAEIATPKAQERIKAALALVAKPEETARR